MVPGREIDTERITVVAPVGVPSAAGALNVKVVCEKLQALPWAESTLAAEIV